MNEERLAKVVHLRIVHEFVRHAENLLRRAKDELEENKQYENRELTIAVTEAREAAVQANWLLIHERYDPARADSQQGDGEQRPKGIAGDAQGRRPNKKRRATTADEVGQDINMAEDETAAQSGGLSPRTTASLAKFEFELEKSIAPKPRMAASHAPETEKESTIVDLPSRRSLRSQASSSAMGTALPHKASDPPQATGVALPHRSKRSTARHIERRDGTSLYGAGP